jgi:hypothetical protein
VFQTPEKKMVQTILSTIVICKIIQNNSEIWKFITCWSHGLIVKLTVGLHTYQAANNIYEQSLGYLDHVHNIHESFLHYQPD